MDELIDNLRCLRYYTHICKSLGLPSINRLYFCSAGNFNEQFYYFAVLCYWLLREAGDAGIELPQQNSDPEIVLLSLFERLKGRGYAVDAGNLTEYRRGYGNSVVQILLELSRAALKAKFALDLKPQFVVRDESLEAPIDADAEITVDKKLEFEKSESESENSSDSESVQEDQETRGSDDDMNDVKASSHDIRPVDLLEWRAELEQVTPQLKVTLTSETKSWRVHQQQIQNSFAKIDRQAPMVARHFRPLQGDIASAIQKIKMEEARLNTHFKPQIGEHSKLSAEFRDSQQVYENTVSKVRDLSGVLMGVSEELERVKGEIDQVGMKKNDINSLQELKKAAAVLKEEIKAMSLRTGIVQHSLFAFKRNAQSLKYPEEHLS